jgi:HAMP domain-containing protein
MKRAVYCATCAVVGLVLFVGCGNAQREATEAAINAAQQAVDSVQVEAAKYVPEELGKAKQALQSARDSLAKGDYQTALASARDAANRARNLAVSAAAKKKEWSDAWNSLNESLPKSMTLVRAKLEAYSRGARLPEGMDKDGLEQAKAQFERLKQQWTEATSSATQGLLGDAVKKASELKLELADLMARLGIKTS